MKIIDEKGKLFGKINIIDFLIILSLFYFIPMFYFGYRLFNMPAPKEKKTDGIIMSIDVYVTFKNMSPQVTKLISVGDKELDSNGKEIGTILKIDKIESNFIDIKFSETGIITKEDTLRKQVTLKIRLTERFDNGNIIYKKDPVRLGSMITFTTDKYEITGVIVPEPIVKNIDFYRTGFSPITLDILFKNLSPEVANSISIGDFEVDGNGDTIAKVLNVGSIEPYTYKINLGDNNYITKEDLQKKQVRVRMEIMGGVEGNAFYFKGKRVALDSEIEFNTNKYKTEGIVVREPTTVKKIEKRWLLLTIRSRDLVPELADAIKEGDMEKDVASGDLLARIESVISITPSQKVIESQKAMDLIIAQDPLNKDITLLLKALCDKDDRGLLFKATRIKINSNIIFQTDQYDLAGNIINIKEINN